MSDLLQPGHHPDADQLSAFAERALPAHEYEETLAHLAVCPDCRNVVALSMPPMAEAQEPRPDIVRKPWFFGWKFALPVAAAVAALTIIVVGTRTSPKGRRGANAAQEAELHSASPAPPPQTSAATPASKPPVPPSSNTRPNTVPAQSASSADLKSSNPAMPRAAKSSNPGEVSKAPIPGNSAMTNGQPPSSSGGVVGGISTANLTPLTQTPSPTPPAPAAPSASHAVMGGPVGVPLSRSPNMSTPAPPAATSPTTVDAFDQSANVKGPVPILTSPQAQASMPGYSRRPLLQSPLPSHVQAISVVSVAHQMLAIDSQNTLFFSTDDGKNWKAIPPQWKGRAVKVALVSPAAPSTSRTGVAAANAISMANFDPNTAPVHAHLQTTGSTLSGRVTDPSGGIIPNADVTITRKDSSDSRTAKTDNAGNYVVSNLAPGNYQIAAQARGFQEQVSTVDVAASEPHLANFTLPVGSVSETVAVEASSSSIPLATDSVKARKMTRSTANNPAPSIFEMTTEDGEKWTSADGKTWKRK